MASMSGGSVERYLQTFNLSPFLFVLPMTPRLPLTPRLRPRAARGLAAPLGDNHPGAGRHPHLPAHPDDRRRHGLFSRERRDRPDRRVPLHSAAAKTLVRGTCALSRVNASESAGDTVVFKKVSWLGREAYRIAVTPESVVIEASEPAGALYAAQTLVQSIVRDTGGAPALPAMTVDDAPRFAWRGV